MFKWLSMWFNRGKLSVDSIVADIAQKVEHLRIVADMKRAEQAAHDETIRMYADLKQAASTEMTRAETLAKRFEDFIS